MLDTAWHKLHRAIPKTAWTDVITWFHERAPCPQVSNVEVKQKFAVFEVLFVTIIIKRVI